MSAKKKPAEESQRRSQTAATELVTVEVINQPLYEAGAVRYKGERFDLPAARAEALRHFVKLTEP